MGRFPVEGLTEFTEDDLEDRIENPLTDLPLVLPGEILTASEYDAVIGPIKEEKK